MPSFKSQVTLFNSMLNPQFLTVQFVKDNFEVSEQEILLKEFYTVLGGFDSQRVISIRDSDFGWQFRFLFTREEFRDLDCGRK